MKRTVAGSLCLVLALAAGVADAMNCATPAPQAGRRLVWGDEEDGWCPEQFRITADDTLPIEYWIDWVRLWQKDGEEIRLVKGEGKR